jgi:elongation factor P
MLSHTDLKRGVQIVLDGEPYEILESAPMKKAQRRPVIQSRIRNLITGNVFERNFQQGDVFEEAELEKIEARFLYSHREKFVFCEVKNPKNRFELDKEKIGFGTEFLKPNQILTGILFQEKFINIILPIKVQLKVTEAPPGIKGDRAQGGTKTIVLETGAKINTPLFIETGDIVEINTETGEYVRRVE